MVKKVAPPAGSPIRARGVKTQGSKARSPRKPRNKWLTVPARACSICRQTTHEADRDFREFVWLEGTQKRHFTKDGAEHPSGNECYRCYHCRRRHFKEFKTLKNLVGKMEKDPSLRDKFEEARKDDIQQTGQWSGIQITPESWTATTKRSIDEAFVQALTSSFVHALTSACGGWIGSCKSNEGSPTNAVLRRTRSAALSASRNTHRLTAPFVECASSGPRRTDF